MDYEIKAIFYEDDGVFVATSESIPGLTLEAATKAEMVEAAMEVVPVLLSHELEAHRALHINLVFSGPQSATQPACVFEEARMAAYA